MSVKWDISSEEGGDEPPEITIGLSEEQTSCFFYFTAEEALEFAKAILAEYKFVTKLAACKTKKARLKHLSTRYPGISQIAEPSRLSVQRPPPSSDSSGE